MLKKQDQEKQQKQQLEEAYERQFPKIARDFVYLDDLRLWIEQLRLSFALAMMPIAIPPLPIGGAITKANEYKKVVEDGEDGTKRFTDIVEIDTEAAEET